MNRFFARTVPAASMLAGALWLAGCGSPGGEQTTETASAPSTSSTSPPPGATSSDKGGSGGGQKLRVAVIPKGLTHSFWQAIKRGAEKAGGEMNVEVLWDGPSSESTGVQEEQQIVENAITKKVDGIVLAPINKKALVPAIDKAAKAKIPVVIADSDADTKNRISFVATDNYKGGAMAAARMMKLIGGKGEVGMVPVQANSQSTEDREKGFEDAIKKLSGGKVKVVRSSYGESDRTISMNMATDMLTSHPNIVAIFGPNESSAVGALNAVRGRKMIGKIKLIGFDTPDVLIEAVKKGEVDSIVVQNPFKMGYEGVKAIVDYKAGKKVAPRIDTGVALLSKDNIDKPENKALLQ